LTDSPKSDPNLEVLSFLLSSFTDNGRSLRAFTTNPQELAVTILTAGLLANSKLMISPEDAVKSAFDIHSRIQNHVGRYQSMQFAANIDQVFREPPQEVDHD
jgi:hypothetical protein